MAKENDLVPVFIPSLAEMLAYAEKAKKRPLSEKKGGAHS